MESKLLAEKKLLHFYKEFVTLIQHHKEISSTYLSQAFMTMLLGHELGRIRLCHRSVYEILLM